MICRVCKRPIKRERNAVRGMHKSCAAWLYDPNADLSRIRVGSDDPGRCPSCGEALTLRATLGKAKCKCDMPRMPRSLMGREDSPYSNPWQAPRKATHEQVAPAKKRSSR